MSNLADLTNVPDGFGPVAVPGRPVKSCASSCWTGQIVWASVSSLFWSPGAQLCGKLSTGLDCSIFVLVFVVVDVPSGIARCYPWYVLCLYFLIYISSLI